MLTGFSLLNNSLAYIIEEPTKGSKISVMVRVGIEETFPAFFGWSRTRCADKNGNKKIFPDGSREMETKYLTIT